MKKLMLLVSASAIMFSCTNAPDADKATTSEKKDVSATSGDSYVIDTASKVSWAATKVGGGHAGTFNVKEGNFVISGDQLTGGSFIIDINSLNNTDQTGDMKGKLEGHLKSPDFFDAAKFGTAKFEITNVKAGADSSLKLAGATHTVTGNLTLKDSTKSIIIPAVVTIKDGKITANTDFNIDRTLWGMNYKGPNNPQDWVISKTVNLKFSISGAKK